MKKPANGGFLGRTIAAAQAAHISEVPLYAANASYFLVLSVFPSLLLILGLLRYTTLEVDDLMGMLEGLLPAVLLPSVERLIFNIYENSSRAVVSISVATALWSASRGIYGLITGLNSIYDVPEDRGYLYTRGISVVYTFLFLIVLLLTLLLHVFGQTILDLLPPTTNPFLLFLGDIIDFRFFFLLFIQTVLFTGIFMMLPNRRNKLIGSLPGALLSSIGWLVFSHLYSIYVENFNSYANLYGSIYAVALSLLWLYFCMYILFCGGVLNRFIAIWNNS